MKKLTKLFGAISMVSVLAFVGCADPNNSKTDAPAPVSATDLDGYYTLNSYTVSSDNVEDKLINNGNTIYFMKNGKISFADPTIDLYLFKDKTLKCEYYSQKSENGDFTLDYSPSGTWEQNGDKLNLTASMSVENKTMSANFVLTKNNNISWPTKSDFEKLDGTYTAGHATTSIVGGNFKYDNKYTVVLKEDGTLTFTDENGKEYPGYWFWKDENKLAFNLPKLSYGQLTKTK